MAVPAASVPDLEQAAPKSKPGRATPHRFEFVRVGGLDQVAIKTGADLLALEELDPKLWVALSCPTKGLELDPKTLALLDTDGDGRVRVPEILAAIRFCADRVRDMGALLPGADRVALASFRDDTSEGRAAAGAARLVLSRLGKPDAEWITAEDVADTTRAFEGTLFNGDGVVPAESAADDVETRQVILDVAATIGTVADRSGKPGVDRARVERFFAEAAAYEAWWRRGETDEVRVLGDGTAAAYAALSAVRARVDDYFVRCGLAAMEPRASAALNRSDAEFAALAAKDLASAAADVAAFPLARVEPGRALPLVHGVNPAWGGALAALRRDVVTPLLGEKDELTQAEWTALVARFAPYERWLAEKQGAAVERLGIARIRAILGGSAERAIAALIARDEEFTAEAAAIDDVVRLVHYHRDLATLLRNFVSFADFYDRKRAAVFQAGTLFLDGRSCDLCIRVEDPAAHAAIAGMSRMYLAYCDCRRGDETMKIVACFTQGDADYLMVGRNGIFFDRRGRDWDATIVKIVENPISLRQAFWAPYKKALRAIEEQVARFAAAKEKESDGRLTAVATQAGGAVTQPAAAALPAPVDVGKMVGVVAALGVGIGALGTLLGGFVSGFMDLQPWWAKVVAIAAVVMIISGPSMLVAWLKLRHRTLGPILDGTGWAVNGRVRVNIPLAAALTACATLPRGARRLLDDPYADRAARRRRRIAFALLVLVALALGAAWFFGRWPFGPFAPN